MDWICFCILSYIYNYTLIIKWTTNKYNWKNIKQNNFSTDTQAKSFQSKHLSGCLDYMYVYFKWVTTKNDLFTHTWIHNVYPHYQYNQLLVVNDLQHPESAGASKAHPGWLMYGILCAFAVTLWNLCPGNRIQCCNH